MEKEKNSKYEIWQPLLMSLILAGGMLIGTKIDDELPLVAKSTGLDETKPWEELKNVVGFIESRYGDSLSVDSITEEAIELLVSKLDPHSYYLSGLDYFHFKERMQGSYIGVGIDYDIINDTMQLIRIVPEGPADRAGLKQGDQVLEINEKSVAGGKITHEKAYDIWRESAEELSIKILTSAAKEVVNKKITKGPVQLKSIPASKMIGNGVGYIKISRFSSDTYKNFMQEVEKLSENGMSKLIIDVRRNPGGSLDQVVKILNQLVSERDQLLIYTQGLNTKKVEYKSTGKVFFQIDDLAVIIDEHSVSASEVLAGSLQDLGRATIVGRRSYGKGLVQEMYNLSPTSAINLTVAKYYLPSGRFIQKSYADRNSYDLEIERREANGELFFEDSIKIVHHLTATGLDGVPRPYGEGIIPDVFVAADSFYYSDLWKDLEKPLYRDAFQYLMHNRERITKILEGDNAMEVLREHVEELTSLTELRNGESTRFSDKITEGFVHLLLWHYYGEYTYYEKMLHEDNEVKAAIEILMEKD
ncbi:MAG: PDZ domain-containing protein [Saprospiraceae bacterium]|nr:PDZ domain-containing protein [Saprospiraceae bacterium]